MNTRIRFAAALGAVLMLLSACGGESSDVASTVVTAQSVSSAVSSGTITAFGSVFVNGHEFDTAHVTVFDDDAGTSSASLAALEVGRSVDVRPLAVSASASAAAGEIHLHPLVRGYVDASDLTAATLTVMDQTVALTASTLYSDHRACLTATTSPCSAITGQADLSATTGTGSAAVAGSYVTVDGYAFTSGSSSSVVATLISLSDAPTSNTAVAAFKAEGPVTAASGSSLSIGALTVNLANTTCHTTNAASTPCGSAFSVGQVVSVFAATAPNLPATTFGPTVARLVSWLPESAGASIELEGKVSSITSSPAHMVVRGVGIDLSAVSSSSYPVVGDIVKVAGTLASNGSSVSASAVTLLQPAITALVGLEGDAGAATAGSTGNTYTLSVLGKTLTVNAQTRLADHAVARGAGSGAGAFNINNFATYLAASSSHHVIVRAASGLNGTLTALSLTLTPTSTVAAVAGTVDAAPAPVNSSASGTPTTFSVHGLAVSSAYNAVIKRRGVAATVAAGDSVIVRGTFGNGLLTVAAPTTASSLQVNAANVVVDLGSRPAGDQGCF